MFTTKTPNDRATWLQGPDHRCSHLPAEPRRAWRLVLLGPPGVGKGTQAQILCDRLHACHLSTGDIFRATKSMLKRQTSPAMATAQECMARGELVPDPTVLAVVKERRACLSCCGGFVLDGFPRTAAQAVSLDASLRQAQVTLDAVINYQVPTDVLLNRLTGRQTCPACNAVYHVSNCRPKIPGVCDRCKSPLSQRVDDREESLNVRINAYNRTTAPLLDYYARRNLLIRIPAEGTPAEIFDRTMMTLVPQNQV